MNERRFLSRVWALARPYWVSKGNGKGLALLGTVIGLVLALVWVDVQFNEWNRAFYNSFETKDQAEFFRELGRFTLLAVTFIVMAVYRAYFQQMLQIEWRTWLTDEYLRRWLADGAHYRMQVLDRGTDNPDQRIAEDLRLFVDMTLSLTLGLLSAVVTLVSFIAILWMLSGAVEVAGVELPGYMVWVALVYAIAGSWITHLIGRPLIGLEFNQQRFEADFRFALVRLRENSEGIALYRGEDDERANFGTRFANVIGNWWALMKKQKQLGWFTSFYSQLAIIFPYIVVSPRYFSGAIPLGGIFQTASAFNQVQGALSWFIGAYSQFATWKATVDRLTGFVDAIEATKAEAERLDGERIEGEGVDLQVDSLVLSLPQGRALLASTTLTVRRGERVWISGPSGSGKSTLFRALAGIWPYWRGRIRLPKGAKLLFLPQKPYLPIGSLRQAVCYPGIEGEIDDGAIRDALERVGLGSLSTDLPRSENWAQVLSGGEQQRVAVARALVNRPDWLFLDEASSSLPDDAQDALYRVLRERLPEATLVSIGHREGLAAHHDRRLRWHSAGESAPTLVSG